MLSSHVKVTGLPTSVKTNSLENGDESKLLAWVSEINGLSVQGVFWADPVEIPVFQTLDNQLCGQLFSWLKAPIS